MVASSAYDGKQAEKVKITNIQNDTDANGIT